MQIFRLFFLLIFSLPVAAGADVLSCDGNPRLDVSSAEPNGSVAFDPPPGSGATRIGVGFHLISLSDIDVIDSRFRFEGYAVFEWCDPRQAFDESTDGRSTYVVFGDKADEEAQNIWIPDVAIASSIGEASSTSRQIEVSSDGAIKVSGFFSAIVATRFDLRRFPFDKQTLAIAMESFSFNRDVVNLQPMEDMVGYEEDLYLPEWRVTELTADTDEAGQVRDRVPFSRVTFNVDVEREVGYYLVKLSVPLVLIVMLSWSVFWMRDESLSGRMRISSTAFLTIVAYQFAVSGNLPKVAYLTLMDKLMIASFILIALTAFENMIAVQMTARNPEGALRLDKRCRWVFPLAFLATIATVTLASM